MTEPRRVLVVGAGIGGLTAALALSRRGFKVDVAERAQELSEIGAGIQLSPNAGRILAELGLRPALTAAATEPSALEIRSGVSGTLLTSIGAEILRARYDFPYWVIHRADLQKVLREAVERDASIRLHLGVEVTDLDETTAAVFARTSVQDLSDVPFSVVVGADGVRSSLRSLVPGAASLRATGRTAWRALISPDAVRGQFPPRAVCAWLGPRAHLVSYPVSQGAAVNLVAIVEERADTPGWGLQGEADDLADHYASWAPGLRALISLPQNWRKYSLMSVEAGGQWSSGRLALLGDAAHAMRPFLAQGAVMAIEDAAVLAECLGATTDVASALKEYEARRKGRVAKVAAAAARTGERYHFSGALAAARDLALKVAGERLILNELDWIYRWRPSDG